MTTENGYEYTLQQSPDGRYFGVIDSGEGVAFQYSNFTDVPTSEILEAFLNMRMKQREAELAEIQFKDILEG